MYFFQTRLLCSNTTYLSYSLSLSLSPLFSLSLSNSLSLKLSLSHSHSLSLSLSLIFFFSLSLSLSLSLIPDASSRLSVQRSREPPGCRQATHDTLYQVRTTTSYFLFFLYNLSQDKKNVSNIVAYLILAVLILLFSFVIIRFPPYFFWSYIEYSPVLYNSDLSYHFIFNLKNFRLDITLIIRPLKHFLEYFFPCSSPYIIFLLKLYKFPYDNYMI